MLGRTNILLKINIHSLIYITYYWKLKRTNKTKYSN